MNGFPDMAPQAPTTGAQSITFRDSDVFSKDKIHGMTSIRYQNTKIGNERLLRKI